MAKKNFISLVFASIAALALSSNARAQNDFVGTDGCAVLAKIVYTEITSLALYGSRGQIAMLEESRDAGIVVCNDTARTISKAFASAMTNLGTPVRWGYPSIDPGDVCWSGFLDQCYPDRNRLGNIANTWSVISGTVNRAMPNGIATDQSIFRPVTLRLALRSELRKGEAIE